MMTNAPTSVVAATAPLTGGGGGGGGGEEEEEGLDRALEPQHPVDVLTNPSPPHEGDATKAQPACNHEPLWRWMLLGGGSLSCLWRLEADGPGVLSLLAVDLGYWAAGPVVGRLFGGAGAAGEVDLGGRAADVERRDAGVQQVEGGGGGGEIATFNLKGTKQMSIGGG